MTPEHQTLLMVKGAIADLPTADREAVKRAEAQILSVIHQNPEAGVLALALVGATLDAES